MYVYIDLSIYLYLNSIHIYRWIPRRTALVQGR